jgi:hypothetical protein
MTIFFLLHLYFGVGKQQQMPNQNYQTIGDALRFSGGASQEC